MCGIMGVLSDGRPEETRAAVRDMMAASGHRGPDGCGSIEIPLAPAGNYSLVLGHTRLSIIDLSDGSRQPMQDAESGSWLAFNGEIYNFRQLRARTGKSGSEVCDLRRLGGFAQGAGAVGRTSAAENRRHVRVCVLGWAEPESSAGPRPRGHEAALLLTRDRARFCLCL